MLSTGGNNFLAIIFQLRNHSVAFIIYYFVSGFQTLSPRTDNTYHLNLECSPSRAVPAPTTFPVFSKKRRWRPHPHESSFSLPTFLSLLVLPENQHNGCLALCYFGRVLPLPSKCSGGAVFLQAGLHKSRWFTCRCKSTSRSCFKTEALEVDSGTSPHRSFLRSRRSEKGITIIL